MTETITVHRVGDTPVELDPSKLIYTDRTRMETGVCPRKRWYEYEYGVMGYVPFGRNDDLRLGSAVHEGIDLLMQGGTLEKALHLAEIDWMAEPHYHESILPEIQEMLLMDGLHMVKAFICGFSWIYLPQIMSEYEVVEVEEETNWLLMADYDENSKGGIIVMSRPDAVLRKKDTGRLWHMSHKTLGYPFNEHQIDKLAVDIQRFAEGYAIWAKYGEAPEGTLYNYFLKGDKREDEEVSISRFSSGLIRPYMNRLSMTGGGPKPEDLAFSYEWKELDRTTMEVKKKRLGKGWEKVDIFREMDYLIYLEWLNEGLIKQSGRNYLSEAMACLAQVPFNRGHAERWKLGTIEKENTWAWKVDSVKTRMFDELYVLDKEVPLESKECFSYNKKCPFYNVCWKDLPIQTLIEEGKLVEREPNHLVELRRVK